MSKLSANPYINFRGHAREALELYQKALGGGELTLLAFNPDGPPKLAGPDDRIMHGVLQVGDLMIMGSDSIGEDQPASGDNIAVALSGTDKELLVKAFDVLSEGGEVQQALKEESWGDMFGYFTDKFGINWMVNINIASAA